MVLSTIISDSACFGSSDSMVISIASFAVVENVGVADGIGSCVIADCSESVNKLSFG